MLRPNLRLQAAEHGVAATAMLEAALDALREGPATANGIANRLRGRGLCVIGSALGQGLRLGLELGLLTVTPCQRGGRKSTRPQYALAKSTTLA